MIKGVVLRIFVVSIGVISIVHDVVFGGHDFLVVTQVGVAVVIKKSLFYVFGVLLLCSVISGLLNITGRVKIGGLLGSYIFIRSIPEELINLGAWILVLGMGSVALVYFYLGVMKTPVFVFYGFCSGMACLIGKRYIRLKGSVSN